ncbi:Heat shock protein 70 like LHS1 [Dissostichus eleginoides]|uniref:Heat shock protein 70 like LHS1 n=1 Tax=Dissostichus eleginoides TaxID=100907 RepID=A0AAD9FHT7_DISEL|nr:Heat shock protein 70 like LHS1 [Dissostichus eleginoides]
MRPSLSCPSAAFHSASITAPAGRHRRTDREGKRLHTHLSLVERQEKERLGRKERVFLLCISFCFHHGLYKEKRGWRSEKEEDGKAPCATE